MEFHLATLDFIVIGIYLAVVLGIAFWVARKNETGEDLFLAGRSLVWGTIGFSLFASNISSTTLIGLAGAAYSTGIAVSAYEWMAGLILVFMSFVVIPVFLKSRITTIPEYLEQRYNRTGRLYFSGITILMSIIVDTAGGIFAGAIVLQIFFPDLILWQTCFALALFAGIYTAVGGLKAVVYTDVIQAIVLILGCTYLTYEIFQEHAFSWTSIKESVPEGHLSIVKPLNDPNLPWLGLLFGVPILGFWYWATNQYITQRILGAKSLDHARWGAALGGFLKLLPLFIMVLPGAMAIAIFPNLDDPDQVFPVMIREILPIGLTGVVLAGLLAAIMSSIDSTLNSASTLIVNDFVLKRDMKHPLTPEQTGKLGKIVTIILMVIAALWAPQIANFKGLFAYLQQAFAIVVPPVAAVFLVGLLWKGATAKAAVTTLFSGHAIGIILFLLSQQNVVEAIGLGNEPIWTIHFTITVGIVTALSIFLLIALSFVTEHRKEEDLEGAVWTKQLAAVPAGTPLYQDYRVHSAVVVALTVLLVLAFW